MVYDARSRVKTFLDDNLTAGTITEDDDVTLASFIVAYGDPEYPARYVFYTPKNIDVIFSVYTPESHPIIDFDGQIIGYRELVPVKISAVSKDGITGTKLRWKAEAELRNVFETHTLGNYSMINRIRDSEKYLDTITLYCVEYIITYVRDVT
jgi:hypothetical protein